MGLYSENIFTEMNSILENIVVLAARKGYRVRYMLESLPSANQATMVDEPVSGFDIVLAARKNSFLGNDPENVLPAINGDDLRVPGPSLRFRIEKGNNEVRIPVNRVIARTHGNEELDYRDFNHIYALIETWASSL